MNELVPVEVECHSGYKADEYPVCFYLMDQKYHIAEIMDRWYQSDRDPDFQESDYFKVETDSGWQLLLKHELMTDRWFMLKGKI